MVLEVSKVVSLGGWGQAVTERGQKGDFWGSSNVPFLDQATVCMGVLSLWKIFKLGVYELYTFPYKYYALELYVGILWYALFRVWSLLCNILFLTFIHTATCNRISSFSLLCSILLPEWPAMCSSIPLLMEVELFPVWKLLQIVLLWTFFFAPEFWWTYVCISTGGIPRGGTARS